MKIRDFQHSFCVLLAGAALLMTGCGSICFRGSKVDGSEIQGQALPCKFRLASYSFSQRPGIEGRDSYECQLWSVPVAVGKMTKEKMEAELIKRRPDMFSKEEAALPVAMSVAVRERRSLASPLVVQFLTSLAGVLPVKEIDLQEVCDVSVTLMGEERDEIRDVAEASFSSQKWFSSLSPLALMKTGATGKCDGCLREWHGVSVPQCHDLEQDVFNETVVAAVVAGLRKMDVNGVRRKAVMQMLQVGK